MNQREQTETGSRSARLLILLAFCLTFSAFPAQAQERKHSPVSNNDAFLNQGFENLADTLVAKTFRYLPKEKVLLQVEAARYQDRFTNMLAERLQQTEGRDVYLRNDNSGQTTTFEAKLDEVLLSYVGISRGVLRFPGVKRRLLFNGYARVLDEDGKLLSTFAVADLVFSDTLSYADAQAAAGNTAFLSPPLPPSPYRRVVEPGLVLGITGALVYLFFASR